MAMKDYCLKLQISQGFVNQDDAVSDLVFLLLLACVMVNQISVSLMLNEMHICSLPSQKNSCV